MTTDRELDFADQVGRYFARQYGVPPMVGRVAGWLLICEPPQQTAAELAEALRASRAAIGNAVATLETWGVIERRRAAGERADRVAVPTDGWAQQYNPKEYADMGALARQGLEILGDDAPPERRARLLETAAHADFLTERITALAAEWRKHRDALRASGELPDLS